MTTNLTGLSIGAPLPGTYRFGVGNASGDFSAGTGGPNKVVPLDLATNTDYMVVEKYNLDDQDATIWVNPGSESDTANSAGPTSDTGAVSNALAAFSFRQSTGEGILLIRNVIVGNTFADVVTNVQTTPVIAIQPKPISDYQGNPAKMEVVASGLGATYQWYQNNSPLSGANSPIYSIASLGAGDAGNYYCAISNGGGTTNSVTNLVSVNTTPTPPTFTLEPTNETNFASSTFSLSTAVYGTGPLVFQWYQVDTNNNTIMLNDGTLGNGTIISGSTTSNLVMASTALGQSGQYYLQVQGGDGTTYSTTNYVQVLPPQTATIGFLRTLQDNVNWLATDTTTLWAVQGVIVNATNQTSGNTSSYYLQDATGGINLFVTGTAAPNFRPQIGDKVAAVGQLASFNSTLELEVFNSNPSENATILSHNNPLPAPKAISFTVTNAANIAFCETNLEGSFVMLTNVYWGTNGGHNFSHTVINMTVTNAAGVPFNVFLAGQVTNLDGVPIPTFSWTVSGVFGQFLNNTATPRWKGYELVLTRAADIVSTAPPAVTTTQSGGAGTTLTWTAVPYSYSYSVLGATQVQGPYTPVVQGLTFTNTLGTYTDTNAPGSVKFYQVVTP